MNKLEQILQEINHKESVFFDLLEDCGFKKKEELISAWREFYSRMTGQSFFIARSEVIDSLQKFLLDELPPKHRGGFYIIMTTAFLGWAYGKGRIYNKRFRQIHRKYSEVPELKKFLIFLKKIH